MSSLNKDHNYLEASILFSAPQKYNELSPLYTLFLNQETSEAISRGSI